MGNSVATATDTSELESSLHFCTDSMTPKPREEKQAEQVAAFRKHSLPSDSLDNRFASPWFPRKRAFAGCFSQALTYYKCRGTST